MQNESSSPYLSGDEDILKIYGDLPPELADLDEADRELLSRWTREIIEERGEAWVRENRTSLLSQFDHVFNHLM
jgi:hypothetical protein